MILVYSLIDYIAWAKEEGIKLEFTLAYTYKPNSSIK